MPRPPRTDVQRALNYANKLVPGQVETYLENQLPAMQPRYSTWAGRQAQLYALMAGVLSGYSVPSYQYSRYYAFGFQVDKVTRKLGMSPAAVTEILAYESVWIGRGYNIVILDGIRDSVIMFTTSWYVIPAHETGRCQIDATHGQTAFSGVDAVTGYVTILDYLSHALQEIATTDTYPTMRGVCPQLGRFYGTTSTSDIVFTVAEGAPPVLTEQPLTAGDRPTDVVVDYDPARWPAPVYGYAWVPCLLHNTLYKWRLDGTVAPTSIALANHGGYACLDPIKNRVYVVSANSTKVFSVDRDTNAIAVLVPPHAGLVPRIDLTHGELWISGLSNHFVCKYDTTSGVWSSYDMGDDVAQIRVDSIRRKCYCLMPAGASTLIRVIDGATGAIVDINAIAWCTDFDLDDAGCYLAMTSSNGHIVQRYHLLSGAISNFVAPSNVQDVLCDPTWHRIWVNAVDPGVDRFIGVILP